MNLLLKYSFFIGLNFGEIFISNDNTSCCIVQLSEKKRSSLKLFLWKAKLLYGCIGLRNILKVLKREKILKEQHPKSTFIHLWYIGVTEKHQGLGKGTLLAKQVIEFYKNSKKPIYLETSSKRNLPFYQRLGFRNAALINPGHVLYTLRKDY